jgi:hypothetical protein
VGKYSHHPTVTRKYKLKEQGRETADDINQATVDVAFQHLAFGTSKALLVVKWPLICIRRATNLDVVVCRVCHRWYFVPTHQPPRNWFIS